VNNGLIIDPESLYTLFDNTWIVGLIRKNKTSKGEGTDLFSKISDFDDLVFENRNRDYGAYQLRKKYNNALLTGIIISSMLGILAVLIPFLIRPNNEKVVVGGRGYAISVRMENFNQPPQEQVYVPAGPPRPPTTRAPEPIEYVAPEVVDTLVPVEMTQASIDLILASNDEITVDFSGSGFGDDLLSGGDGSGWEEPLYIVEEMPTFRGGGIDKFRDWIGKRCNYPEEAIINKIRGTVFITFIVEKDGSVSNVTIIKGVHPLIDDVAVKAISESPKWSPGLQRGQPVRVRFQIPLSFTF
jgi:protein TonB